MSLSSGHFTQSRSIEAGQRHTARILAMSAVFWMSSMGAGAHAGMYVRGSTVQGMNIQGSTVQGSSIQGSTVQGSTVQGSRVQGSRVQGTRADEPWLQGMGLAGVVRGTKDADAVPVSILGFRGDVIDAFLWNEASSWERVELEPRDLEGLEWLEQRCPDHTDARCAQIRYRIADARRDYSRNTMPRYADNSDIWLYKVEYTTAENPAAHEWKNVCTRDRDGLARGMFVNGRWQDDGSWRASGYTFSCTTGVIAKCARSWGYKPWKRLPGRDRPHHQEDIDLRPLHQACTRAARADYCGDGISHTRNGTLIDMFDIHGLNVREQDVHLAREAGFTERGAAWVARERWPTGNEDMGAEAMFETCRRPRQARESGAEPALIEVWSDPRNRQ